MRVNIYTEELLTDKEGQPLAEIVTKSYISSRTGQPMTNHGLRIFVKSHPDLHYVPPRDDDRGAVTFWCGPKEGNIVQFLHLLFEAQHADSLRLWREKTGHKQVEAEQAMAPRTEAPKKRGLKPPEEIADYIIRENAVDKDHVLIRTLRTDIVDAIKRERDRADGLKQTLEDLANGN